MKRILSGMNFTEALATLTIEDWEVIEKIVTAAANRNRIAY